MTPDISCYQKVKSARFWVPPPFSSRDILTQCLWGDLAAPCAQRTDTLLHHRASASAKHGRTCNSRADFEEQKEIGSPARRLPIRTSEKSHLSGAVVTPDSDNLQEAGTSMNASHLNRQLQGHLSRYSMEAPATAVAHPGDETPSRLRLKAEPLATFLVPLGTVLYCLWPAITKLIHGL